VCPERHCALEALQLRAWGLQANDTSMGAAWQFRGALEVSLTWKAQMGLRRTPMMQAQLDYSSLVLQFVMEYSAGILRGLDLPVHNPISAISSSVLM